VKKRGRENLKKKGGKSPGEKKGKRGKRKARSRSV